MKNLSFILIVLFIFNVCFNVCTSQDEKEILFRTEEIEFHVKQLYIKGDLILPKEGNKFPAVIFCTGSGPTNRKQSIKSSKVIRKFIEKGFAFFIDDKPGSGESKGEFSGDSLLRERAMILEKEIEILKHHPSINPGQIGLYGSSQAGYVMSIALEQTNDVAFMIAWSCPAMNSIEQSAYLVKKQTLCEGNSLDEAEKTWRYFIQRAEAKSYSEYREAAEYLDKQTVIKDLGWGGVYPESDFTPIEVNSESYINPVEGIGKITFPSLFIFGENDTQIDPLQGAEAFNDALKKAGNKYYKIITIQGVDHNMRITKTGCLKEQKENYNKEGGAILSPEFLESIDRWLEELKIFFNKKR